VADLERTFAVPLTIGVVSDTHVYERGRRQLPIEVLEVFERAGVGLIVHAGDLNDRTVLSELEAIAPVLAVHGNNDTPDLLDQLPAVMRFGAGRFTFVLVHGHQGRTARAVARTFAGSADLVIYGHSHIPKIERVADTILFNPGSPTDRRWGPHFGIGLIRVTAEQFQPELLLFADPRHLTAIDIAPTPYTVHGSRQEDTAATSSTETRSDPRDASELPAAGSDAIAAGGARRHAAGDDPASGPGV